MDRSKSRTGWKKLNEIMCHDMLLLVGTHVWFTLLMCLHRPETTSAPCHTCPRGALLMYLLAPTHSVMPKKTWFFSYDLQSLHKETMGLSVIQSCLHADAFLSCGSSGENAGSGYG